MHCFPTDFSKRRTQWANDLIINIFFYYGNRFSELWALHWRNKRKLYHINIYLSIIDVVVNISFHAWVSSFFFKFSLPNPIVWNHWWDHFHFRAIWCLSYMRFRSIGRWFVCIFFLCKSTEFANDKRKQTKRPRAVSWFSLSAKWAALWFVNGKNGNFSVSVQILPQGAF